RRTVRTTYGKRSAVNRLSCSSKASWKPTSETVGEGAWRPRWYQYPPLPVASRSSLTASHTCVVWPSSRSSGALGPPILVGTHPGSTTLLSTLGHRRGTANASAATKSLLSE